MTRELLVVALLAAVAATARVDNGECLGCHGERIAPSAFEASAHAALGCGACHTDIAEYPHPEKPAAPDCASCHTDVVEMLAGSVHPADGNGAARCAACHGDPHRVVPHTEARSPVHWTSLASACARCHADTARAGAGRIPLARPVEAYLRSVHARAVATGRRAAVCSDCHGAHDIVRASDPRSPLARAAVSERCGSCHQAELTAFRASVHGAALARGVRHAPTCTDCHGEHGILSHTEPSSRCSRPTSHARRAAPATRASG